VRAHPVGRPSCTPLADKPSMCGRCVPCQRDCPKSGPPCDCGLERPLSTVTKLLNQHDATAPSPDPSTSVPGRFSLEVVSACRACCGGRSRRRCCAAYRRDRAARRARRSRRAGFGPRAIRCGTRGAYSRPTAVPAGRTATVGARRARRIAAAARSALGYLPRRSRLRAANCRWRPS